MTGIFISYSRRDKAIADYIATELRNRGAEVFIDYQKLQAGENFIGRLGREIEARDTVVLLVSPRSVASKWVQAEVAWAFTKNKPIIPVQIEPASLVDFFFLINVEQVDFTRYSLDGQVGDAVRKLANSLGLPDAPLSAESAPPLAVEAVPADDATAPDPAPTFARSDLGDLFTSAVEIAERDPEQAVFLYRQVLEIDPDYLRGQAKAFVEREEARLKPPRLANMLRQAQAAMEKGKWERGQRTAQDMLALDPNHAEAQNLLALCEKNTECEPLYQQAGTAAQAQRWVAAVRLLRDVARQCPDYGDPLNLHSMPEVREYFFILPSNADQLEELASLSGHTNAVKSVAFSPDGALLASGSDDWSIRLWDAQGKQQLAQLSGHTARVISVAFSPNGALLASGAADKSICLWDVKTQQQIAQLTGHTDEVWSVAFSPDGALLASGSRDHSIRLWDVQGQQQTAQFSGHTFSVRSVVFSPDGALLASGSFDKSIRLWDVKTQRQITQLSGHTSFVFSVAFSPDGALLASGSGDTTIRLWDVKWQRQIAQLTGHTNSVASVTFSPDGMLLASCSYDNSIRLWDVKEQRQIAQLTGHTNSVLSVSFSPDGTLLASGSDDGTIKLWGVR